MGETPEDRAAREGELFRLLVQSVVDYAIFVTDPEGLVQTWSCAAQLLLGYTEGEVVGQSADRFYTPEEVWDGVPHREREQALATGRGDNDRWQVRKDGSRFWSGGVMTPLRDDSGTLRGFAKIMRDRTEWRSAEEARRRGEERIRSILESITDAFFVLDRSWNFTYVNSQAEWVLGRQPGDLLGKSLWQEYPGLHGTEFERAYREAMADGVASAVLAYYPDHDRWYEVHIYPAAEGLSLYFRDVTERTRAQERERSLLEQISTANAKFRALFEQGPLFAGIMAVDGTLIESNRLGLEACGYTREQAVGRPFWEGPWWGRSPELVSRIRDAWEVAAAGGTFRAELPYFVADGRDRIVDLIVLPIKDEAGRVTFLAQTGIDITDRKQAEQALAQSEKRFRHLADAMPQIVWVTRPDRSVEYVNRRWLDYTGQTNEQALSPSGWPSAIHPDDLAPIVEASIRSHSSGGPFEAEYRIRDAQGRYRWHLGRAVPFFDESGHLVRRFGAAADIDDRKRIESDAQFLAEASGGLATIVDEASTLQKVAHLAVPGFADWCWVDMADEAGVPRRLAIAHKDPARVDLAHELHRRFPPDPDAPHGAAQVIRTGSPELVQEITPAMLAAGVRDEIQLGILRALGLKSFMCVPIRGRERTLGAISFVAAESGRRYGAVDLRLAEDLAARAAIAIENARLYAELKETDRRKDEFLATLAHELRNPLAPIRNILHLLREPGGDGPREAERAMAERNVVHLARLIDDLMDVARISRGKIELSRQEADLATIVNQAVETARPLIDERRQGLTVTMPEGRIGLEADPTRLEQVFWNLLNNAAKYTSPGGQIRVTVEVEGPEVLVSVRDSGIGIRPEMLPRVFDMFVQIGEHKNYAQGGLGIGLSLVRTLVEMHGGAILARSDGPGQGSEFVVRLPRLVAGQAPQAPELPPRAKVDANPPRRRILVVDDNVDAARSLARLLSRLYGQDVRVAHDGPEALAEAETFLPEVVLLDIGLPGMDGNEVARIMRGRAEFRDTLLVALTGWGQESDMERSRAAGFDHHLVKPANPEIIRSLLIGRKTTSEGPGAGP